MPNHHRKKPPLRRVTIELRPDQIEALWSKKIFEGPGISETVRDSLDKTIMEKGKA